MIKAIARSILSSLGYEIRKKYERGFYAPYLAKLCSPKTVIDVGIGNGTHELYKAFPRAKFVLIEPLTEFQDSIKKILSSYNAMVYYKALGRQSGQMEIEVNTADPLLSSFNKRPGQAAASYKKQIEVTTLNQIFKDNSQFDEPILLKIDTEGHELEVLAGASEVLNRIDTVILEVSIRKRFENSYDFAEIINFMHSHGFKVFDFLTICYEKDVPGANLTDIVFKRK